MERKTARKPKVPHANCLYLKEKDHLTTNIIEIQKKVDVVYKSITEPIELKNGTIHHKTPNEAIKDSWERINNIQENLIKLDNRTQILDDFQKLVSSFKDTKSKSGKLLKPIGRFFYKLGLILLGFYLFILTTYLIVTGNFSQAWDIISLFIPAL
jgi:hypothetical protein